MSGFASFICRVPRWHGEHSRLILELLLVFVIAFAIKYSYLQERARLPDLEFPTMDSLVHEEWAEGLAFGKWSEELDRLRGDPYFRAPLYPYFVAGVYRLLGHDPYKLLFVQILIGSASVVLMFLLTRFLFGVAAAYVAVVLQLGYWPITYMEAERLIPVLLIIIDLSLVLVLMLAGRRNRMCLWAVAGCLLGLSAIARPNILVVIPFVVVWIYKRARPRSSAFPRASIFIGAAAVVVLVVAVRNVVIGRDFVPISSQGGVNFYIGNNRQADGVRAVVPGTRADWWRGYHDTQRIAEESLGRPLRPSQISHYWFVRGLKFLLSDPRAAIELYGRKALLLLGNGEVSNNRQLYFQRAQSRVLSLLRVNFSFILGFSLLGLVMVISKNPTHRRSLDPMEGQLPYYLALPYALSILVFFVTSRYRVPVALLLIPGCAFACTRVYQTVVNRRWITLSKYALFVGPIVVASSLNPFGVGNVAESRGYYDLGVDFAHTRTQMEKALDAFDGSIAADPSYAPAWKMRGCLYDRLENRDQAIVDLIQACRLDSEFVDAYYSLGVVYHRVGRYTDAHKAYERAIEIQPDHVLALNNLADILMRAGRPEEAVVYLRRALTIDPEFPNAIYGLGYYYETKGVLDSAVFQYRRACNLPGARIRLVIVLEKLGRTDEAEQLVRDLQRASPQSTEVELLRSLLLASERQ